MCLWSIRDAALLQLPLKSLTVLDVASALGLLGMLARHAASKTQLGRPPPTPPHTPIPINSLPIVYESLLLLGCVQKRENSRGPAV